MVKYIFLIDGKKCFVENYKNMLYFGTKSIALAPVLKKVKW